VSHFSTHVPPIQLYFELEVILFRFLRAEIILNDTFSSFAFGKYLLGTLTSYLHGSVVVSVFATGPKGREFEPGQGDGFYGR
jgi:hypothetical protein